MKWIKIANFRICLDHVAAYEVDDNGNTFIHLSNGTSRYEEGSAIAETLDAELHLRESAARPVDVTKLSEWSRRKLAERQAKREAHSHELDVA
jgi:hypothetical protein